MFFPDHDQTKYEKNITFDSQHVKKIDQNI